MFTMTTSQRACKLMHADHRVAIPILHVKYRAQFLLGVGWCGMAYWVNVTLSCHNWKRSDFRYSGACFIYQFCVSHKFVLAGYSRHKKKTTFIGGMELVSLRCNRDFTSYKYAIALSDTSSIPPMHGGFLLLWRHCNEAALRVLIYQRCHRR